MTRACASTQGRSHLTRACASTQGEVSSDSCVCQHPRGGRAGAPYRRDVGRALGEAEPHLEQAHQACGSSIRMKSFSKVKPNARKP